jgi:hypothetical protein
VNTEVITMHDKEARDRIYQDLRKNGDSLEQQVVCFSSQEQIIDAKGNLTSIWVPTWSVAYPRS